VALFTLTIAFVFLSPPIKRLRQEVSGICIKEPLKGRRIALRDAKYEKLPAYWRKLLFTKWPKTRGPRNSAAEQGESARQFSLCHNVAIPGALGLQKIPPQHHSFNILRIGALFTRVRGRIILGSLSLLGSLACRTRVRSLPSPALYIQQWEVSQITKRTHPTNVVLLLEETRFEWRPLLGLQHPIEGTVGHPHRCV
jgi:hypothetical protein